MNDHLYKRALVLSYFTVGYNLLEGTVSMAAGWLAGSIALIGFALDSLVESLSGGIMIWRFGKPGTRSREEEQVVEAKAVRWVAYTFFILAAYVSFESIKKLYTAERPDPSLLGIIVALLSLVVMPVLFFLKFRTGKLLGSSSLVADSKETLACVFLSGALLAGLGLNYLYGIWEADPVAGLIVVGYLVREGTLTLKESRK